MASFATDIKRKRRAKRKAKRVCKTTKRRVKGRVVRKKVCRRKVVVRKKGPSAAAPPITTPTAPVASPPQNPPAAPDPMVYSGPFGARQAERLLWRAGFGPKPGECTAFAARGRDGAISALTRPAGAPKLVGPAPTADGTNPLQPEDQYAHDHLYWLDRMVRSDQPLVERMALIFHDWFGLRRDDVGQMDLVFAHIDLYRRHGLGSFRDLLLAVTRDPAMLLFLNGANSDKNHPNENYGREVMELFTLGADRGAYTEFDVREAARALTGWRADYVDMVGWTNFRYEPGSHDSRPKTIFGHTGNFDWRDVVDLCLRNPYHRSHFVLKLWSYFIAGRPDAATQASLERLYIETDYSILAVVEAILRHPALYTGSPLVKPPVVYSAGLLRARGHAVDTTDLAWWAENAGQRLFAPPNVSGWNDQGWLDTSTIYARWRLIYKVVEDESLKSDNTYSATETPEEALAGALAYWGDPPLTDQTRAILLAVAQQCMTGNPTGNTARNRRAQRQNALRHLIPASPDLQTC